MHNSLNFVVFYILLVLKLGINIFSNFRAIYIYIYLLTVIYNNSVSLYIR